MIFTQFASGSSGNLYCVTANNGKCLIIDPGLTWIRVQRALEFKLKNIEACLLTHSHFDHCKAALHVQKSGIDIYSSKGTFNALDMRGRRIHWVATKTLIRLESFEILCFDTIHDAPEPLGYVIREKATGEYLLFCTDSKTIKQRFPFPFTIIAIECSYNGEYLAKKVRDGTINESLAKRLLDSHMEETECLRYLQEFCDLSHCRVIHLLHLSADNINKKRIRKEFEKELFIKVVTI